MLACCSRLSCFVHSLRLPSSSRSYAVPKPSRRLCPHLARVSPRRVILSRTGALLLPVSPPPRGPLLLGSLLPAPAFFGLPPGINCTSCPCGLTVQSPLVAERVMMPYAHDPSLRQLRQAPLFALERPRRTIYLHWKIPSKLWRACTPTRPAVASSCSQPNRVVTILPLLLPP